MVHVEDDEPQFVVPTDSKVKEIIMERLATQICNFMFKICDTHEFRDCYKSFEDFVTETTRSLYDAKLRKGIAADLKGMAENEENDNVAREAACLYRKVIAI